MSWRAMMGVEIEDPEFDPQYPQNPVMAPPFEDFEDTIRRRENENASARSHVGQERRRSWRLPTHEPKPSHGDLRDLIDERAAIMEFDGGLSRPDAERLARESVRRFVVIPGGRR